MSEERTRAAPSGIAAGSIGWGAGGPVWLDAFRSKRPPALFELVNAFKGVPAACIRLNANGGARVPLRLYSRTGPKQRLPRRDFRSVPRQRERYIRSLPFLSRSIADGDRIHEITEHPFLDALRRPNPYFDGYLFLYSLFVSLDVCGAAYIVPERPLRADGRADTSFAARVLWPLQAQYVFPVKGTAAEILKCYRYFGDEFTPEKVVRIRYYSQRDPYLSAYAPLHQCFEQVGIGDYYTAVVESTLKEGARPNGMISPKEPLQASGDEERKRLEVDVNNRFTGGRSGRVLVTSGAYNWTPFTYPPTELAGLEVSKWERLIVANCFDVPISLLQSEDSNRAVASEATHQHQYYAIAPRCEMVASALTTDLAWPVDERLFFAFDDPVQRDRERDGKIWQMKLESGAAYPNQWVEEDGDEPLPWGEEPFISSTKVQPSAAAEEREARGELRKALADARVEQAKKPAPDPEEVPGQPPRPVVETDQDDEGERALLFQLSRVLTRLEYQLEDARLEHRGHDRGHGVDCDSDSEWSAGRPSSRGEHVRPAAGVGDRTDPETVVRRDARRGPIADPGDGRSDPVEPSGPPGVHEPHDGIDDAGNRELLGHERQENDGAAGSRPGAVGSDEPVSAGDDPPANAEVLQEHERDDDASDRDGDPPAP